MGQEWPPHLLTKRRVYGMAKQGAHIATLQGHSGPVDIVIFSAVGSTFGSEFSDSTIRLRLWGWQSWDLPRRRPGAFQCRHIHPLCPHQMELTSGFMNSTVQARNGDTGVHISPLLRSIPVRSTRKYSQRMGQHLPRRVPVYGCGTLPRSSRVVRSLLALRDTLLWDGETVLTLQLSTTLGMRKRGPHIRSPGAFPCVFPAESKYASVSDDLTDRKRGFHIATLRGVYATWNRWYSMQMAHELLRPMMTTPGPLSLLGYLWDEVNVLTVSSADFVLMTSAVLPFSFCARCDRIYYFPEFYQPLLQLDAVLDVSQILHP
jgi:hypothetical protein